MKKEKKKEKESVRKREKMGGIRERKTVRSFLPSLNPKFQSFLILFLRLFFPRNKHKPISHNSTHIFYLVIYFIVLIFSKSHRTSLSYIHGCRERERKREKVEMIFLERESVNSRICINSLPFPSKPKYQAIIIRSKP